ncbi:GTP 3',8-cyclase MoaA [bacterium]|nr:GTP 3',8-cyclase MoaA [bacterium]
MRLPLLRGVNSPPAHSPPPPLPLLDEREGTPFVPPSAPAPTSREPLEDQYGRRIRYIRVSITDRCNLKCVYCTSQDGFDYVPKPEILSYEEILAIMSSLVPVGLEKVRITGGEPLVRRDVVELVRGLGKIGLERIALSTNGILLAPLVDELHAAGLNHLNVSLDTQDPDRFREITRGGKIEKVWQGIERALEVGVSSVKINCVLLKGVNDSDFVDMARIALRWPIAVRFIELMPLDHCGLPQAQHYVSAADVLSRIERELGKLEPIPAEVGRLDDGPASYYRLSERPEAKGTIGVITPQSHSFCSRCNRVRLSATGQLKLCLFGDEFVDLRAVVRRPGWTPDDLIALVRDALTRKPKENAGYKDFAMQMIGG